MSQRPRQRTKIFCPSQQLGCSINEINESFGEPKILDRQSDVVYYLHELIDASVLF